MMEDDLFRTFAHLRGTNAHEFMQQVVVKMLRDMHTEIGHLIDALSAEQATAFDPYAELGIHRTATKKEIDHAYRDRSKSIHPDRGGTDEDMKKVNLAYELIYKLRGWK